MRTFYSFTGGRYQQTHQQGDINPILSCSQWSRGGHRHLQIGRMLDIDLISEPPPPTPPPPRCMNPKCGNLCGQRAGSDSWLAGVSGYHIYVPEPHAPPPRVEVKGRKSSFCPPLQGSFNSFTGGR
jgi:hypothetical protein